MPLTEMKIRNAKPQAKPYKLSDGEGMFLLVHPNGGKYWRLKYRFAGRERILAFGVYPEVSLADARERRLQARKALATGQDPGVMKQEVKRQEVLKGEHTFEAIALDWYAKKEHEWTPRYADTIKFGSTGIFSLFWEKGRWRTSPRRKFWTCCGWWKKAAR
jgi:hypothetical protein